MADFPKSTWLMSLFASATKAGGTKFSAVHKGDKPIVIMPGQRISLIKSSKVASNGSEIWSLLADDAQTPDADRVHENTSNVLARDRRPAPAYDSSNFDRDPGDTIPF